MGDNISMEFWTEMKLSFPDIDKMLTKAQALKVDSSYCSMTMRIFGSSRPIHLNLHFGCGGVEDEFFIMVDEGMELDFIRDQLREYFFDRTEEVFSGIWD